MILTTWLSLCKKFVIFPVVNYGGGVASDGGRRTFDGPTIANSSNRWRNSATWEDHWTPVGGSSTWKEYHVASFPTEGVSCECNQTGCFWSNMSAYEWFVHHILLHTAILQARI